MARYHPAVQITDVRVDYALIGGTGIASRLAQLPGRSIAIPTQFGLMQGRIVEHRDARILTIARHSAGHKNPPHRVNYLAIAEGARRSGARFCISSAAVGGLRSDWPVGTMAICTDMLDFSSRHYTRFNQQVEHIDFTRPFPISESLIKLAQQHGIRTESPATYATTNGPRYETPAEIEMLRILGADLVGMTVSSEAIAMREAGVSYGCIAIVTNAAAGMAKAELNHLDVVHVMETSGEQCVELMLSARHLVE